MLLNVREAVAYTKEKKKVNIVVGKKSDREVNIKTLLGDSGEESGQEKRWDFVSW